MMQNKTTRSILMGVLILVNIGCDQITKNIVRHKMSYEQSVNVFKQYFIITRVENTGAFLSAGNSLSGPLRIILLLVLPLIAIVIGIIYLLRKSNLPLPILIGLCCVIGGGTGNLFDRAVHGSVTDFLYMNFVLFHTGVFNMADLSITTGVLIMLFNLYFNKPLSGRPQ